MNLQSYSFVEHDFLELCRLVDKVQIKAKSNNLTSEYISKALRVYVLAENYGREVWVELWSAFSCEGFKFSSHCTHIVIKKEGGIVRRCVAPLRKHARGDHIQLSILEPVVTAKFIQTVFPSFREVEMMDENYLIFSGE